MQRRVKCAGGPYDGQVVWVLETSEVFSFYDGTTYRGGEEDEEWEFDPTQTEIERRKRVEERWKKIARKKSRAS